MGHHKLSDVVYTLNTMKNDVNYTIQMIENEKRYSDIMQQISKIHSKLNKAEQMMLDDLAKHNLLSVL